MPIGFESLSDEKKKEIILKDALCVIQQSAPLASLFELERGLYRILNLVFLAKRSVMGEWRTATPPDVLLGKLSEMAMATAVRKPEELEEAAISEFIQGALLPASSTLVANHNNIASGDKSEEPGG